MRKFFEKTIRSKRIYKGRLLGLRKDTIELPNKKIAQREIVEHPGAVAVIALTKNKKMVLVKQYRKAVEEALFEVPAGVVHRGETGAEAAKRELEEETGYKAGKIKEVLKGYVSPGYSTELIRFFLATELSKTRPKVEEDELIGVKLIDVDSGWRLIKSGKIKDNKTIIGIILAKHYA